MSNSVSGELEEKIVRYEKALKYIKDALYTQYCTMSHMENTEYENGQKSGLLTAMAIVESGLKRNKLNAEPDDDDDDTGGYNNGL